MCRIRGFVWEGGGEGEGEGEGEGGGGGGGGGGCKVGVLRVGGK